MSIITYVTMTKTENLIKTVNFRHQKIAEQKHVIRFVNTWG